MYRKKGVDVVIEDILAKVRDPDHVSKPTPIVYADSDIIKAKTVLDRLLAQSAKSDISSIQKVVTLVRER